MSNHKVVLLERIGYLIYSPPMQNEQQVLQLLSDGHFHSGEDLGKLLNVTRSAVWKTLKQIEAKYALSIHAVKGKGYRLEQPCELLDKQSIISGLKSPANALVEDVLVFSTIDSTHTYAANHLAKEGVNCAVLAEHQSSGKGRRGRTWASPFASNIYLSLTWRFDRDPMALTGLSLAVGVAVVRALKELGIEGLQLKWPNDIYWKGKKLGGVLIDVVGEAYGSSVAVVSLGLNVSVPHDASKEITQAWVDLKSITGQLLSRNQIVALVLNHLSTVLIEFEKRGLDAFVKDWEAYDYTFNKPIRILRQNGDLEGVSKGINSRGELLLETTEGLQCIHAGDVSLRLR